MGYTTDFSGEFEIAPPLKPEHRAYLEAFAQTRRMKRHPQKVAALPDQIRKAAGLPVGLDGGYYVGADTENFGQDNTPDVLDHNRPPNGQPGLWCQWVPNEAGDLLEWDGGEKFYDYVEWLEYLIEHFFQPWGYVLNGVVRYYGEDSDDRGLIRITDNAVESAQDRILNDLD